MTDGSADTEKRAEEPPSGEGTEHQPSAGGDEQQPAPRSELRLRRFFRRLLFEEREEPGFDEALIRTYLASERTFLAWLRSAVVLLGVGLGAVALGSRGQLADAVALALGGLSVFAALVMVVWAYIAFGSTTVGIERRRYRPARGLVATATFLMVITGGVVLVLMTIEVLD